MTAYRLSKAAMAALTDIYVHSLDAFGSLQADRYLADLFALFEDIVRRDILWRPIPTEFGVSGYFARHERHFVYWKQFEDGSVGIAAILHASMMQGERLKEAFGEG